MKSFNQYIKEYKQRDIDDSIKTIDDINVDVLKNCGYASSFMDDRSWLVVDNVEYNKIKENTWQATSRLEHGLPTNISSEELYDLIKKNKGNVKIGQIFKSEFKNVSLD